MLCSKTLFGPNNTYISASSSKTASSFFTLWSRTDRVVQTVWTRVRRFILSWFYAVFHASSGLRHILNINININGFVLRSAVRKLNTVCEIPAGTWRVYNVALTSIQRHDERRCNVMIVMTFIKRRMKVDLTSWRLYNIAFTSIKTSWSAQNIAYTFLQPHDVASTSMRRYINVSYPLGYIFISKL